MKIRKIYLLVLTHPDPDHLKGLNFVASHFSIGHFWDNGFQGDSESYIRLQEILLKNKIKRSSLNDQTLPQMIHGAELSILNPPVMRESQRASQNSSLLNNQSLVMMIQFRQIALL